MAYRRRRTYGQSTKDKPPKPYRSWLEYDLHQGILKDMVFEPFKIPYISHHKYTPDFVNESKKIIFEAKGKFDDSREAKKYVDFRECNPEWTIVFVFERPHAPIHWKAKRKKCGTKMTYAQWATKNNFDWCCPETIRDEWL